MKKLLLVLFTLAVTFVLVSCGTKETIEMALITDTGKIDDHSFNEGSYNGLKKYAEENDISYTYYKPQGDSNADREAMMEQAIDKGAKVIVLPGFLFEVPVANQAAIHTDVMYLLIDGSPHDLDGNSVDLKNVVSLSYEEAQSGYLAGYVAVKNGWTKLGFVGGIAVPAVVRFGYGYIQGAEAAAEDMDLAAGTVTMNYWYSGTFTPDPAIASKANTWNANGMDVVFSCGGGIWSSVATSGVENLIGVDTDQAALNDKFVTSAMKELASSVYDKLDILYNSGSTRGTWPSDIAGKHETLGIEGDYVGLASGDSWKLTNVTEDEYQTLYAKVKAGVADGTILIDNSSDTTVFPTTTLVTVNVE